MKQLTSFPLARLGDLAEVYDGPHATPRKVDQGPWYLNIASLKNGRLDLAESARIHEDDVAKWTRRVAPQRNDTLFSYETRLGEAAFWDRDEPAVLGRRMGLLRPRPGMVCPRFLAYAYLSDQFQEVIRMRTLYGATGVNRIPIGDLPDWLIAMPPLDEQKRIAGALGAFDDLIEMNRKLASELHELVRTAFLQQLEDSAYETRLTDIASFINGRNFTKGASGSGRPVIRTPEVRTGPDSKTVRSNVETTDQHLANPGDILFVWSGTLMVERWRSEQGLVNQHVFKVIPTSAPDWYVYFLIDAQMEWYRGLAKDKATTMGHIKREHLDEPIKGLAPAIVEKLHSRIGPLWTAALELAVEADELTRQRDELLPLLMSGKVRVSEVSDDILDRGV